LSNDTRLAATLPQRADDCAPDGRDATETLRIDGLVDRATLARPSNSTAPLRLSVRALGSEARIRWLLDGRLVGETRGAASFSFDQDAAGAHTLTALAETGAWAAIAFRVME
jgi:penicillin-binding protein 1C